MELFAVVYDGASRPMIQTPMKRLLSISEFNNGRWGPYEQEDQDCHTIVEALNWVIVNGPVLISEGRI